MGFMDSVKGLFGKAQSKLPEDMNSVEEIRAKAQDLAQQHGDQINKVVNMAQDKIPGTAGDSVVDGAQEKLNDFSNKPQQ